MSLLLLYIFWCLPSTSGRVLEPRLAAQGTPTAKCKEAEFAKLIPWTRLQHVLQLQRLQVTPACRGLCMNRDKQHTGKI